MKKLLKEKILGIGRTAEIYPWNDNKALKLFFSWCPRDWVESEARLVRSLQIYDIPIVKVFEIIEIGNRLGIIYDRVYGTSLLHKFIAHPEEAKSIGILLAQFHHQIHKIEAEHLQSLHIRLSENIKGSKLLSIQQKHLISATLDTLPRGNRLCHMDYHPGQILKSAQGTHIIDWGAACKGNPLADVACTIILLRIAQIPSSGIILSNNLTMLRKSMYEAYLDCYLQLQDKASKNEIQKWVLVMAASRLSEEIDCETNILNDILDEKLARI